MTKTIAIRNEVYKRLLAVKRNGESFSDLFERLIEEENPVETLKRLRGRIEIKGPDKEMVLEISKKRAERRI